jgi:hypothetical protein
MEPINVADVDVSECFPRSCPTTYPLRSLQSLSSTGLAMSLHQVIVKETPDLERKYTNGVISLIG